MINRFLAAQNLNVGDELVWYKFRPNSVDLKCTWRKTSNESMTFLAQRTDDRGDWIKTYAVFTMYVGSTKT